MPNRVFLTRRLAVLLVVAICAASNPVGLSAEKSDRETSARRDAKRWPLMRGDAAGSGVAQEGLPEKLKVLWRYRVKKGAFSSTAVIDQGTVYLGDLDGTFFALDLNSGKEKWQFKTDSSFSASAAVGDGKIYSGDIDGRLYCLDATSGKLVWKFVTESGAEISSSPNFYKENVVIGSQDGTLYALDAKSGDVSWEYTIDDQIRCSPTIIGNRTFLAGCDSKLHIVNLDTGKGIETVQIGDQTGSTPAARGDFVYFGSEGGNFFAVNWKTAEIAWTFRDDVRTLPYRSSAAITPKAIIFGGRDKRIRALDPAKGTQIWEFVTRGRVDSSPVVVGDRLYVGSTDGRIYGLDCKTGNEVWRYEAGGAITGSAAIAQGRMVIASEDGVVYCFGAK